MKAVYTTHSREYRAAKDLESQSSNTHSDDDFVPPVPPTVERVVSTFIKGSWFGAKGQASREGVIVEWTNLAIVCGLGATMACTGLFAEIADDTKDRWHTTYNFYIMSWCFGVLGLLTATGGYVLLIIGGTEMHNKHDFQRWAQHLGIFIRTPLLVAMVSGVSVYSGIVLYFILVNAGEHFTWTCIIVCAVLLFLPIMTYAMTLVWAILNVEYNDKCQAIEDCDEDHIYEALKKYFIHECHGKLNKICRDEFLFRFYPSGEVPAKLAEKIFDDWLEKKLNAKLRQDPGF